SDGGATKASEQWLALVDQRNYDAGWQATSSVFRDFAPERAWIEALNKVRIPLGDVSHRKVANVTRTKSLPGLPDGDYIIVQFETAFARKATAVETLTLVPENGMLKVAGYFIK